MSHTYDVGTKAWQPDPTEGWVASEVTQKLVDGEHVKLVFSLANGEVGVIWEQMNGTSVEELWLMRAANAGENDRDDPLSAQRRQ